MSALLVATVDPGNTLNSTRTRPLNQHLTTVQLTAADRCISRQRRCNRFSVQFRAPRQLTGLNLVSRQRYGNHAIRNARPPPARTTLITDQLHAPAAACFSAELVDSLTMSMLGNSDVSCGRDADDLRSAGLKAGLYFLEVTNLQDGVAPAYSITVTTLRQQPASDLGATAVTVHGCPMRSRTARTSVSATLANLGTVGRRIVSDRIRSHARRQPVLGRMRSSSAGHSRLTGLRGRGHVHRYANTRPVEHPSRGV